MKLSISNIAWAADSDEIVYDIMKKQGFSGLEIAPTRIFLEKPYEKIENASEWSKEIMKNYGFEISSIQSIWYGREEKIFGSSEERQILIEYTKKAIDFAATIKCRNIVFGCPKNRNIPENADPNIALDFFKKLGDYAASKGTKIGMEANPTIYHTNYINDTETAIDLIEKVDSEGFKLNLDVGTMIQNGEKLKKLIGKVNLINHVHISEPFLRNIEKRALHKELKKLLEIENYNGYVSIEIGRQNDISVLEDRMRYIKEIFG